MRVPSALDYFVLVFCDGEISERCCQIATYIGYHDSPIIGAGQEVVGSIGAPDGSDFVAVWTEYLDLNRNHVGRSPASTIYQQILIHTALPPTVS
jgi:hypothetical protein